MSIDQVIQFSYLSPTVFGRLDHSELKLLMTKIRYELNKILQNCPQSQDRDQIVQQYRHALHIINRFY